MTGHDKDSLAPLARRDGEPVFDEPWQAQALGLAFSLAERGVFSPAHWSQALGAAHRRILAGGASDTPQTYYQAVVAALEGLLRESGEITASRLDDRTRSWRRAYLNTPHGRPVALQAGLAGGEKNVRNLK